MNNPEKHTDKEEHGNERDVSGGIPQTGEENWPKDRKDNEAIDNVLPEEGEDAFSDLGQYPDDEDD